jgi:hypothetical protein
MYTDADVVLSVLGLPNDPTGRRLRMIEPLLEAGVDPLRLANAIKGHDWVLAKETKVLVFRNYRYLTALSEMGAKAGRGWFDLESGKLLEIAEPPGRRPQVTILIEPGSD